MRTTQYSPPLIRPVAEGDAAAIAGFYNGLSAASLRTFRPLGAAATVEACEAIVRGNLAGEKLDRVAELDGTTVGWGFVWDLHKPEPMFGLAVADAHHARGIGRALTNRVLADCDARGVGRIVLTVVIDNVRAKRLYELAGFVTYGQFHQDGDGLDYFRMSRER